MGGQTTSQVHASSTQVAKRQFQCGLPREPVQRKTILRPTCIDLCWVAKRWKTCVHLRANLSSIKVDASHRKPWQVHASRGQTESLSEVTTSFQLAITYESVWPGPNWKLVSGNSVWSWLAWTCDGVRWLAFTLIELKFARKWKQAQRKSTKVGFSIVFVSTAVRVRLHWNSFFATCVEPSMFGHPSQVCVRKFAPSDLRWLATPFRTWKKRYVIVVHECATITSRRQYAILFSAYNQPAVEEKFI